MTCLLLLLYLDLLRLRLLYIYAMGTPGIMILLSCSSKHSPNPPYAYQGDYPHHQHQHQNTNNPTKTSLPRYQSFFSRPSATGQPVVAEFPHRAGLDFPGQGWRWICYYWGYRLWHIWVPSRVVRRRRG